MSKPHITLKIGGASASGSQGKSPVVSTPTPGGGPKFRLSMGGGSKPSTPNENAPKPVQKTKAGRAPKPSAKAVANKNGKRVKDESDDDGGATSVPRRLPADAQRAAKKIKLVTSGLGPKTPTVLKAKFKGKPPQHPLGEGYDSEASDREEDPVIEEEFVLRMLPGDDCEYLHKMIDEKKIGLGRKEGGADVQMKYVHPEGRRAVVTIRGRHYAAAMVDLPCVIEAMKSWDKKGWYKSADICQALLVFAQVAKEADAGTIELPRNIDPSTFQYPHGLTPPMQYARKRRFRKRISRTAIEAVEDAVEKLLEADARAESTRYEMIDPEGGSRNGSRAFSTASPGAYGNDAGEYSEDAEGELEEPEESYFTHTHGEQAGDLVDQEVDDDIAANFEAEMEAALEADLFDAGTPTSNVLVETPDVLLTNGGTPEADGELGVDSGDDSSDAADDDDDDDAEDEDDEVDEDERSRLAQLQGAKEDIAEMERQLSNLEAQMTTQANPILKRRIKDNIEKVKAELQLKKSAIGEADED